ncbi:MAG: DVUA0089 family protein [Phycisphaerales bacterium]
MRRKQCLGIVAAVAGAVGLAIGASAQTYNEQGDAGSLPSTAQAAAGSGTLTAISGTVDVNNGDYHDVFVIEITDPANFAAYTGPPGTGTAQFDTQLWLFDESGMGILSNDDDPAGVNFSSGLFPPADDGTGQTIPGPGRYLLGITNYNEDPISNGGEIFFAVTYTERSGPDGPGSASPLSDWTFSGFNSGGTYTIELRGAAFVSGGPTLAVSGSCPGVMDLTVTGATPGGRVAFLYAFGTGSQSIPPGNPCEGTTLGLNSSVQLGATANADANGEATVSPNVPAGACGRVFIQAIDLDSCNTTNVEAL